MLSVFCPKIVPTIEDASYKNIMVESVFDTLYTMFVDIKYKALEYLLGVYDWLDLKQKKRLVNFCANFEGI